MERPRALNPFADGLTSPGAAARRLGLMAPEPQEHEHPPLTDDPDKGRAIRQATETGLKGTRCDDDPEARTSGGVRPIRPGTRWPNLKTVYDDRIDALVTTVTGPVGEAEIAEWAEDFASTLANVEPDRTFRLLVDVRGYEPDSLATHKSQRAVIIDNPDVQRAAAIVFVHHDVTKMEWMAQCAPPGVWFVSDLGDAVRALTVRRASRH